MNHQRQRRRKSLQGPPARLGWPAACSGGDSVSASSTATTATAVSRTRSKSSRRVTEEQPPPPKNHLPLSLSLLWTDAYAPRNTQELCIAPKKQKEVASFMQQTTGSQHKPQAKLLILIGSPGIGKSTMVRLIAAEQGMQVSEWNESCTSFIESGCGGSMSVDQQSSLNSFQQFMEQSGVGFHALNLSRELERSARSRQRQEPEIVDLTGGSESKKRKGSPRSYDDDGDFDNRSASHSLQGRSLILLEELPNLHTTEAHERFRHIMEQHIRHSVVPTVLIISDVVEGKCRPDYLERLIPPHLLYSELVRKLEIHPATKARFHKVLSALAVRQGFCWTREQSDDLHEQTSGDIRSAITTLQFQHVGDGDEQQYGGRKKEGGKTAPTRDKKLSTFHALGKLLYAKRDPPTAAAADDDGSSWNPSANLEADKSPRDDGNRGPLNFDPEHVIEHSDSDLDGVLSFVGYHSLEFFSDVSELSVAWDYLSDAAHLLERPFDGRGGAFPEAYVGSLSGRAVAHANKHPAPSKFRQFTAPAVYQVYKKRLENQLQLQQLDQRLGPRLGQRLSLGCSSLLASDQLPYLRKLLPDAYLSGSLDRLQSHFRPMTTSGATQEQEEQAEMGRWKEQEAILQSDDIGDYDEENRDIGVSLQHGDGKPTDAIRDVRSHSSTTGTSPTSALEASM